MPPFRTVHVESRNIPYIALSFSFRGGSALDPPGQEGLAFITANMLLRGTRRLKRDALLRAFDQIGSSPGIHVAGEGSQVGADCATRHLHTARDLLEQVLARPAFPAPELDKLKRQTMAEMAEMTDDDSTTAAIFFAEALLAGLPYAHPARGYPASVSRLTRKHVLDFYRSHYVRHDLVLGTAGDLDAASLDRLVRPLCDLLPDGAPLPPPLSRTDRTHGLKLLLVTRPDRTQAQVVIGQTSVPGNHPLLVPLSVAITGFGGTFTSLLVREIREKRGWSYGVGCSLNPGLRLGTLQARFAPKNADVVPAIDVTLSLLNDLAASGLPDDDLAFARSFLVNHFPFLVDTPVKRLDARLAALLTGKPEDWLERYVERIQAVTPDAARTALSSLLTPDDMTIVVVGDPSLERPLSRLPGLSSFRTVPYTWNRPLSS